MPRAGRTEPLRGRWSAMEIPALRHYLDDSYDAGVWLCGLGIVDVRRAHGNLLGMATAGVTLDLLAVMASQLERHLPGCADPDMALHNLERFVAAARNPLAIGTFFERDPQALPTLLQIFSASQYLSDLLVSDPEGFDLVRLTEGQPVARQALVDELTAEIAALEHETVGAAGFAAVQTPRDAANRLRRHRPRAEPADGDHADFLRGRRAGRSGVAGGAAEVSGSTAACRLAPDGEPARFVVLGLGKLGGLELNYSSDIDLIFLCERRGPDRRPTANIEHRVLRPRRPRVSAAADRANGVGQRLPRRYAAAARGRARADGHGRRGGDAILRQPRPNLGAAGIHQGPARGRRSFAGPRVSRIAGPLDLSALLEPRRHQRHQGAEAADRAGGARRRPRPQREDRPRRHPRHRVRHPIPPVAQRRRSARTANRQHAGGPGQVGSGRLPDKPGAVDPGRELHVPAEDRAPAANHARPANASAARAARRSWPSWRCGWATRRTRSGRRSRRSWPTIAARPS